MAKLPPHILLFFGLFKPSIYCLAFVFMRTFPLRLIYFLCSVLLGLALPCLALSCFFINIRVRVRIAARLNRGQARANHPLPRHPGKRKTAAARLGGIIAGTEHNDLGRESPTSSYQ